MSEVLQDWQVRFLREFIAGQMCGEVIQHGQFGNVTSFCERPKGHFPPHRLGFSGPDP